MKQDFKPINPKDRVATNRLDLSLFPDTAVIYGALGMTEGDSKYGGYNYRVRSVLASVYVAACRRHIAKWFNGQEVDPKTRVHHLASALACVAILIDAREVGVLRDDRPPQLPIAQLLDSLEASVKHLHTIFPNGPARFTEVVNGSRYKKKIPPKRKTMQKMQESIATPKARKRRPRRLCKRAVLR